MCTFFRWGRMSPSHFSPKPYASGVSQRPTPDVPLHARTHACTHACVCVCARTRSSRTCRARGRSLGIPFWAATSPKSLRSESSQPWSASGPDLAPTRPRPGPHAFQSRLLSGPSTTHTTSQTQLWTSNLYCFIRLWSIWGYLELML